MPIDTRLSQIQTNKLIASGTTGTATGAKLLIYPHEASDALIPNQGFIDQTVFDTGSIGTDVFLYVSGGIGQKDVGDSQAIAVFGGDVHISGNLSIDGIGAGGENYFWSPSDPFIEASGSLAITGSFRALSLSASNGAIITGSLAHGLNVLASGIDAHAQGFAVTASGFYSHAEGESSFAGGFYSHAEGDSTNAGGIHSHAEGRFTVASGDASHTEGLGTVTSGEASHAEGASTRARGDYSHAEGLEAATNGVGSHAEGFLTSAGILGFDAQIVDTSQEPALGIFSLIGYGDIAALFDTVALGSQNRSIITDDFLPIGDLGRYRYITASFDGINTHITASDDYGIGTYRINSTLAIEGSFIGFENRPGLFGAASHSEGLSDPLGQISDPAYAAVGAFSHVEGIGNYTFGVGSHAEGNLTQAYGRSSHTEGSGSKTFGVASHAEGLDSIAIGSASHAEGWGTIASGSYQHVQGKYNLRNNDFSLFVIGDGVGDSDAQRGDIIRVNSGSAIGAGRVEVTGTLAATRGLSGSLTKLVDGSDYLIAGPNITIVTNSLGQVEISGSASGGGGGSLQDAYLSGSTITTNALTGSVIITGNPGSIQPVLRLVPQDFSARIAIDIKDTTGTTDLIKIYGNSSTFGDAAILFKSAGQLPGRIMWSNSTNIDRFSGNFAQIYYQDLPGDLILSSRLGNERIVIEDAGAFGGNIATFKNATVSAGGRIEFLPGKQNGFIISSGSFLHSGSFKVAGNVEVTGTLAATRGLSGSLTKLVDGTDYLIAGTNITLTTGSNGAITIDSAGGGGLATGKQHAAAYVTTNSTIPQVIGQFSWVPADYTGLASVTVRTILSTDGTANHTGSLQIYNLTSGSYIDLIDTPSVSTYFVITSSTPTLITSSNLLTGITNFDNSSTAVYEVRVSGSNANNTIVGGVELIFN